MTQREEAWRKNYAKMKAYVTKHGHLPNKRKKDNLDLVNWWKYNKKRLRWGLATEEQAKLLRKLDEMRTVRATELPELGSRPREKKS